MNIGSNFRNELVRAKECSWSALVVGRENILNFDYYCKKATSARNYPMVPYSKEDKNSKNSKHLTKLLENT